MPAQKISPFLVLNEPRFLEQLGEVGLPVSRVWSGADYRRRRDHDLDVWRQARARLPARHPVEPLLVARLAWRATSADR